MGENAYRSEGESLGNEIVRHKWTGMPGTMVLIAIIFIGLPVGLLVATLTGAMKMGDDWNVMTYLGSAMIFAMPFFGAWILRDALSRRNDLVVIHDQGVVWHQKGVVRRARFRDVVALRSMVKQEVRNGIPGPVVHRHVLRCEDRSELAFTHGFEDIEGLAAALRRKTSEQLLPKSREALREGRSVAFGPITLNGDGLTWSGTKVPWKELGEVEVIEGYVCATNQRKKWMSVQVADVDNAHVLLELAAQRTSLTASA